MIKATLLAVGLALDGNALFELLLNGGGERPWGLPLAQHTAASVWLAVCLWYWLPENLRRQSPGATPLLFNFAFLIPVAGILGILAALLASRYRRRRVVSQPFASVVLPEFVLSLREPEGNFNQSGIRSRLAHPSIPAAQRLRSMLALQGMPPRISNPLLQGVLGDATDDVRLVAYGLLDSREKKLHAQIHQQLVCLKTAEASDLRLICQRELAELYWELVYSGLAQGDLRSHALDQALAYAEEALRQAPRELGLSFLKGRILHEMGRGEEAYQIFDMALAGGLAASRVLPYMAEIAFERGDHRAARSLLARIPAAEVSPFVEGAVHFWASGRAQARTSFEKAEEA